MAHEAQVRYSDLTLAKLRATSVMYGLFNHSYNGSPVAGAVKIPVRDEVTASAGYNKATGADLSAGETKYATLVTTESLYVNELIDGFDAAAVPGDLIADRIDSAGYSMGIHIDSKLIALCAEVGTGSVTLGSLTDEYKIMKKYVTAAKKQHVRPSEMWFVVSPDWMEALCDNDKFVHSTIAGDQVIAEGRVGKVAGVLVVESDNMPAGVDFILGNNVFCHFVDEWAVPVAVKDLADGKHIGACALQGRESYGRGISRTATVFAKKGDSYSATSITNGLTMPS